MMMMVMTMKNKNNSNKMMIMMMMRRRRRRRRRRRVGEEEEEEEEEVIRNYIVSDFLALGPSRTRETLANLRAGLLTTAPPPLPIIVYQLCILSSTAAFHSVSTYYVL
ncbi:hypothetical protein PoB_007190100 [Plakobranchus ocellatus]|uniref:Uncharacterized protein n=1 Tax=Plakobranchus ocellatus TaxID=259542 RepID=A0AAV4DMN1_9GAST|nr:hypothetical protein PoB_007190100 [Plakobranchus ocellatus]